MHNNKPILYRLLFMNRKAPELTEAMKEQLIKEFGSYRICPQHGWVETEWRKSGKGKNVAQQRYICLGCYQIEQTHHTKFPKGKDKYDFP